MGEVGGLGLLIVNLLLPVLTTTRAIGSPGNGISMAFSLSRGKRPACRVDCGKGAIYGPSRLKLRLTGSGRTSGNVRRADLVSNFARANDGASAFSRA